MKRKDAIGFFVGQSDMRDLHEMAREREGVSGWHVGETASDERIRSAIPSVRGRRAFAEGGLVGKCLTDLISALKDAGASLIVVDMNRTRSGGVLENSHDRTHVLRRSLEERGFSRRDLRRVRVSPERFQRILSGDDTDTK